MDVDAADISVEVSVHYPGKVSGFAIKLGGSKGPDEEAGEVSRGHSRSLDPTEGPNRTGGKETHPS
jgi:hypothetical protein